MKKPSKKSFRKKGKKLLRPILGLLILFLGILLLFNIPKKEKNPSGKNKKAVEEKTPKEEPLISIVMDDLGQSEKYLKILYEKRLPLTLSFIPELPFSLSWAEKLNQVGYEIILHIPMEPINYPEINPGTGVFLSSMGKDEIEEKLKKYKTDFPFIRGVNNHMGSSFTSNKNKMLEFMEILKKEGLYFLDSRTTPETKGVITAQQAGVFCMERDVFLDNVLDKKIIKRQFEELLKKSKIKNYGIGICHPHTQTFEALLEIINNYEKRVKFVKLSEIFEYKRHS